MKRILLNSVLLLLAGMFVSGCSTTTVKSTYHEPAIQETAVIPEAQLLDVGINIFKPGVDEFSPEEGVFPQVRKAEGRYIPVRLMETLQQTGNWGVVRVIPDRKSEMDLWIDGEILKSDGEVLAVNVKVQDSSGKVWYTRKYEETASKYAYDSRVSNPQNEPFQGLYNRIANDLLLYRQQLSANEIKTIRTITELKFAKTFSPEAFNDHIATDKNGHYIIMRLPADNDPILQRIKKIRERDNMFVDTLQDYYGSFTRQMDGPYFEWRKQSYEETVALRELRSQSNARLVGGIVAVLAGIAGVASDSSLGQAAGTVGIIGGGYAIKSGLDKRSESKIHAQALEELGASLNAEIEPHTLELEDRTVTLSGTVDEQYSQWKQILRDIYMTETGQPTPGFH